MAPTLSAGDVVVADDLSSRNVRGVREAIEARGASLLFPPAYSPDLNPIEQMFAKLKSILRRAEPRLREALLNTIGQSLGRLTRRECSNYLANCGYRLSARNRSSS